MERIPVLVKPFSDVSPEAEVNLSMEELAREFRNGWNTESLMVCHTCGSNLFYITRTFTKEGLEFCFYCAVCGRFVMGWLDPDVKAENHIPKKKHGKKSEQ